MRLLYFFTILFFNSEIYSQGVNDYDGNVYHTISIAGQFWFSKNLNVAHFRNGDSIPEAKNMKEWKDAWLNSRPAWCYPDNKADLGYSYGKLYNWFAVNDSRGLAPEGYRIPNFNDWMILVSYFGDNGLNSDNIKHSGFEYPRAGYRDILTGFSGLNEYSSWWASDLSIKNNAWHILVGEKFGPRLMKQGGVLGNGISIRCIKLN